MHSYNHISTCMGHSLIPRSHPVISAHVFHWSMQRKNNTNTQSNMTVSIATALSCWSMTEGWEELHNSWPNIRARTLRQKWEGHYMQWLHIIQILLYHLKAVSAHSAYITHLKTYIFTFFVAIQPKNKILCSFSLNRVTDNSLVKNKGEQQVCNTSLFNTVYPYYCY